MIIKEPVKGELIVEGDKVAIRLDPVADSEVYLAYALVTQGPGYHILPSFILDDWGNEIGQMGLYRWISEEGLRFPRSEIFGSDPAGNPVQYFLRDVELFVKYPVYAFESADTPDSSGRLLNAVLVPGDSGQAPVNFQPSLSEYGLLAQANVSWWRVGAQERSLAFL